MSDVDVLALALKAANERAERWKVRCEEARVRVARVEELADGWVDSIRAGHQQNPQGHPALSTHERDLQELCAALDLGPKDDG